MSRHSNCKTSLRFAILVTITAALAGAIPAAAQSGSGTWIYTVNYECGYQQSMYGVEGYEPPVKMANYATKIDVYNPLSNQAQLGGDVLATVGWPAVGTGTGSVSFTTHPLATVNLAAGNSLRLGCAEIAGALGHTLPDLQLTFLSGVATVRSATPLAIWVTKTSEVCAGLVASPIDPTQPIFYDDAGLLTSTGGSGLGAPIPSLFGCPAVETQPSSGPILQPGGMGIPGVVVPGIRPPGMVLSVSSTFGVVMDVSVSQSIDSEQVTGIFIPAP